MASHNLDIKPKVLVIENSIAPTGALNSILRSSTYLNKDFDFYFVLPPGNSVKVEIEKLGFNVMELPMVEIRKSFISLIIYLPYLLINAIRLRSIIKEKNIALIINNDYYNLIAPLYRMFGGKVPYVCFVRFRPSKFPALLSKVWSKLHSNLAFAIIAVSEVVRRELPENKGVVVVGNELPVKTSENFVASSKLILYPANYIDGKGHRHALESFNLISFKYPEWSIRFVGGDMGLKKNKEYKRALIQQAYQLKLEDKVEWLDFSNNLEADYNEAAFVLIFSESESFSMICLEAMFYNRAVIATRCGGPEEIIDHLHNGILVPVGDVAKMAEAIEKLITDYEFRNQIAKKGYESVISKYAVENTIHKLKDIYQLAIS